jgi:hypothetical protein
MTSPPVREQAPGEDIFSVERNDDFDRLLRHHST